jgi:hypothetical protein
VGKRKSYLQAHVALYVTVTGLMNSTTTFVTTSQIQVWKPAKTEHNTETKSKFFVVSDQLVIAYMSNLKKRIHARLHPSQLLTEHVTLSIPVHQSHKPE